MYARLDYVPCGKGQPIPLGGKEVSLVPDRLARPSDILLSSLEGESGP
jgi:hypothetical protein